MILGCLENDNQNLKKKPNWRTRFLIRLGKLEIQESIEIILITALVKIN